MAHREPSQVIMHREMRHQINHPCMVVRGEFDGYIGADMPNYSRTMMNENLNPGKDATLMKDSDVTLDMLPVNHASTNEVVDTDSETISHSPNQGCGTDRETNLVTILKGFTDDVASGRDPPANKLATFILNGNSNDLNEVELETLMYSHGVDFGGCNVSPTDEILESWKESRKKDGIFLPFQVGLKRVKVTLFLGFISVYRRDNLEPLSMLMASAQL